MASAHGTAGDGMITKNQGFTLLELVVVMVIMGILLTIAFLSFQDLQQRSDVDQKVKQMYTDLINARIRAIQRGRDHFVSLASTTMYRVYEDTFIAPDGNGTLDTASDTLLSTQGVAPYTLVLSTATMTLVQFTSKGILSAGTATGWVRINTTVNGEYNCVAIDQIKTGMGKMNGANCIVK